jgi:Nitroreductase family.
VLFSKPVEVIILERKSVRTYKDLEIPEKEKSDIKDFISRDMQTPFNSEIRFEIIETKELGRNQLRSLGTYGMISGAKNFIAGTVKRSEQPDGKFSIAAEKFIDYGFALEKIILYLTDADFGTCWLGGTFNKAGFSKKINIIDKEIIPAVTPFGYESTRRALVDRMIRGVAGSKHRKQWDELFFKNDFTTPLPSDESGIYTKPLEMIRIAPSASNKQPWRILKDKNGKFFHLFLQRTRNYLKTPFGVDMQMLDMGIAMCHFELTCRELAIEGIWQKLKSAEVSAAISANISGEDISYIATWVV